MDACRGEDLFGQRRLDPQGRLQRWLDPGPEPDYATAPSVPSLSTAAAAAVDEVLPLRVAGRW